MSAERDRATEHAVKLAQAASDRKDIRRALQLLEYAQRLAPSDREITFDIGRLRMSLDDTRAAEAFELVAHKTGLREAWLALGTVRFMAGDAVGAAAELDAMLRRTALPEERGVHELLGEVAQATGALGWCGVDSVGRLTLGVADISRLASRLTLLLDGAEQPLPALRGSRADGLMRGVLREGWERAGQLELRLDGRPLLGSRIDLPRLRRAEGFVAVADGGVEGWCWVPADADRDPTVDVATRARPDRRMRLAASEPLAELDGFPAFARPRRFRISAAALRDMPGTLDVRGPDGRALYGSPVSPADEARTILAATLAVTRCFPAATGPVRTRGPALLQPSVPAGSVGRTPRPSAMAAGVDVVIPVYLGREVTLACIASVRAVQGPGERIVVVVDASPDRGLVDALLALSGRGEIVLHLQAENRGFPATANVGLRAAGGRDVVLLNSDTLVTPGWLARLRAAVHAAPDIGTATPLSNDATIFSYPRADEANPLPDLADATRLAALAASANDGVRVDAPTAHGFCMYIRARCLAETGVLREDVFGQGYGEENDWSQRATHLGWRHVAVPGAYVAHVGGQSFAAAKTHLIRRNLAVLNRLHPGYDRLVADWLKADPLAPTRRALDLARFRTARGEARTVLLVTHDRGGGVKRHVLERAAEIGRLGGRAVVLSPATPRGTTKVCQVDDATLAGFPNLAFEMPREADALEELLREERPVRAEVHHLAGHAKEIPALLARLRIATTFIVHDYATFCPRITLSNRDDRYCGEPALAGCRACVADYGSNLDRDEDPGALADRSRLLLKTAGRVVAPSQDAARRIARRFDVPVTVKPWEDDTRHAPAPPLPRGAERRRIVVAGAIGPEKGFKLLVDLARHIDAARLPLDLVIVGYTCDDKRLLAQECVTITGRYDEREAVDMIRAARADFGFLPALWPETWSYVLTQLWAAGLMAAVFDIGAPAERVRRTGWGVTLPLNMPVERLAALFLRDEPFAAPRRGAETRVTLERKPGTREPVRDFSASEVAD